MTAAANAHDDHGHGDHGHGDHAEHVHEPSYYIKTWALLLVLLVISIAGPMLEIRAVTLITAFGIAVVKAFLVCKRFMHLDIQPKFVVYFLSTTIAFMFLFFFAAAPDVLKHHGTNWSNYGAIKEIERHGGHDGGADVHDAAGHGEHATAEHAEHGAEGGEEVNPALKAYRESAAEKLKGVDAGMKAIAAELSAPTTTTTTTTESAKAPEAATEKATEKAAEKATEKPAEGAAKQ